MLSSMTGFASTAGQTGNLNWSFEVKSVNGRGLDVRLNLPSGCEKLEHSIRALFKKHFARGNMQASLQINDQSETSRVRIDTHLMNTLSRRARIHDQNALGKRRTKASDLFPLRGIISSERSAIDISPEDLTGKDILDGIKAALEQLDEARKREGKALADSLDRIVSELASETKKARGTAEAQPAQMLERLKDRVAAVLDESRIAEDRLEQEVAILITKADVTEEIDRLLAHFEEARRLINSGEVVGRKLDFLSQELLREANTLGSKAASLEMTRHALALKSSIDQFKEQAANVE